VYDTGDFGGRQISRGGSVPEGSPYRHIACAIDEAEASRQALAEAARLAADGPSRLSVVHVAELSTTALLGAAVGAPPIDIGWQEDARALLAAATADLPGAETILLTGDPDAQVVCDWAERAGVDLLVAGVHRGAAARVLQGSFALHLAYHAPCPVLLVGPGAAGQAD
jgi:nucleotide-binding universal stress UspA family protein